MTKGRRNGRKDFLDALIAAVTTDCIVMPYALDGEGYAIVKHDGRQERAAAYVCRAVHGERPSPRHQAAHSCPLPNKACVNPFHIRWATPETNNGDDKVRQRTILRGSKNRATRLTEDDVRAIRIAIAADETFKSIGARYGVSSTAISFIAKGKNWGWLS